MATFQLTLPPIGTLGEAEISDYTVSRLESMRSMMDQAHSGLPMHCEPGTYRRVSVGGRLQMSNTRMELITNSNFIREARGKVLIAGLGIGFVLTKLRFDRIEHITIVEKSADLIALTSSHFNHPKVTIVHGDIWKWLPQQGAKYDTIYFDIWPSLSSDNLPEMTTLHRRFRKYLAEGGWMDSWSRHEMRRAKRRGY